MNTTDTIAAIATPPGEGGVGIVRISGAEVWEIADAVFSATRRPSETEGGTFLHGRVVDAEGEEIDDALCLIFRAPHSYTGENAVEIQGHGGAVVLKKILRRCLEAGARPADPGEFTRRAFLNGKMDLVQAEAVADLIHAQSDRAAKAAFEQLEGRLSSIFNALYDGLVAVDADLETTLDFVEDELPDNVLPGIRAKLIAQAEALEELLATWDEGRLLREGARVVIMGRPNTGKSTLLNLLLGHDRAIVTDIPGTTRDTLEEGFMLDGISLRVIDTAGLRDTECEIEREGIRRARAHAGAANIAVYLIDTSRTFSTDDADHLAKLDPDRTVVVLNKTDIRHSSFVIHHTSFNPVDASLTEGIGLDEIKAALAAKLAAGVDFHSPAHAVISERHRDLLVAARTELAVACSTLSGKEDETVVLAAGHLRDALESLGQVTGRTWHDELLDNIFSRFCIGK